LHRNSSIWHHAASEILGNGCTQIDAAGWSWGYCSAVTRDGRRWTVDAHKDDGKRYIAQSDELLSAFLALESVLL
jgi:hypothetical protein